MSTFNAPRTFTREEKEAYKAKHYPRKADETPAIPYSDTSPIFGLSKQKAYQYLQVVRKVKEGYTLHEACQICDADVVSFRRACKNHATLKKRLEDAEQVLVELAETALKQSALGLAQDVQEIYDIDENGMQKLCRKVVTTQKPDFKAINKILSNLAPEKWNKDKETIVPNQQNNFFFAAQQAITQSMGE